MAESHVTLRHKVTGGVWSCPAGAVGAWLGKGWEPVGADQTEAPDGAGETPVDGEFEARKGRNPKGSK